MNLYKLQLGFFIALIALTLVLNFFIVLPYVSIIFLAIIFAIVFEPVHLKILQIFRGSQAVSALASVLVVLVVIFVPLTLFGILLFQESSDVYTKISSGDSGVLQMAKDSFVHLDNFIKRIAPNVSFDLSSGIDVENYAKTIIGWISSHLAVFFSSVLKGLIGFLLMVLALFYFFKDGKNFVASLVNLSPLFDVYDAKIISKLKTAVNSVVRGQLMISVIQGLLTGVGFYIFGVPNPVIWAAIAAVASLIPTIGTGLVLLPAIVFLFLTGHIGAMLGLVAWGVVAVGLVDNVLGPVFIKRGVHIHPFIILMSVLGGISLFGPIGFIAGPVSLSLLFALLDIYPTIIASDQK